ncbi:Proline utilization trans-activator [Meyerozyma sp. JA9]|nr:Proline utilization trans-activator [Meyerozyma sp. JA9]
MDANPIEGLPADLGDQSSKKRTPLACIRCRMRHIRCPGGDPCKKCVLAKTRCEYVEGDKKVVVSLKYLTKLHQDIGRLKRDNAALRNDLKQHETTPQVAKHPADVTKTFEHNSLFHRPNSQHTFDTQPPEKEVNFNMFTTSSVADIIHPTLDKYGRLIHARTGEKLYVGPSSMTLFGLEIQNMVPAFASSTLFSNPNRSPTSTASTTTTSMDPPVNVDSSHYPSSERETRILEKEGNAYKITLAKTNTRPGLSVNFTMPSYSYAMLLVDTFVNYNDGCFYFFNEGLVKSFLMNLYAGDTAANMKILKRNYDPSVANSTEDDAILETLWFCKVMLIFSVGEMYLGTESSSQVKQPYQHETKTHKKNTLPGSQFFYQASELFTGLFASGAIDNTTKDGGIEVLLLYAFYLQVADCTIASYFYFGMALRSALILGWHVDAEKGSLNKYELEHRRRVWWTVYMYERMLSSKAGLPLSFTDDSVSTELPQNLGLSDHGDGKNVTDLYIFPPAEYINNCVLITQINAIILSSLYTKQPTVNILPVVSELVHKLLNWKSALPEFLQVNYGDDDIKVSRLIVNLMTEYFQGMNLAVRPLLFHFATKKLQELQSHSSSNKYIDLTKYPKNVSMLLNASFQASINTIRSIWALVPENMVALFGWMDREYLFTSSSTLILFSASFGVHEATKVHLDHALTIFTKMKRLGNYPAALRRAQLVKLISSLDFNGVMTDLVEKHGDDVREAPSSSASSNNDSTKSSHGLVPDHEPLPQDTAIGMHADTDLAPQILPNNNGDLADIEGFAFSSEEHKLWNEITHEAVWLNMGPTSTPWNADEGRDMEFASESLGGYNDIVNYEFQAMDD